ncbi:hypothetical protein [Halocola ammonii]
MKHALETRASVGDVLEVVNKNSICNKESKMLRYWIEYKILVRKLYAKRIRTWNYSADALAVFLAFISFISLLYILESLQIIRGIGYASLNWKIPLSLIGVVVYAVLYGLLHLFSPFHYNPEGIHLIKKCFKRVEGVSRLSVTIGLLMIVLLNVISFIFMLRSLPI